MVMKNNKGIRSCLLIIGGVLIVGLILLFGYRYMAMRVAVNTPPPQVLIHRPYNHAEVSLEEGTFVHATASSDKGITRIELWIDGDFVKAEDAPQNGAISPMVLHAYWQPAAVGTHEVIVRAYDTSQMEGGGSILLSAVRSGELDAQADGAPPVLEELADPPVEEASLPAPAFGEPRLRRPIQH